MGNQDSASAGKARAFVSRERNYFFASNIERLAGRTEQAASEELETDCENLAKVGLELEPDFETLCLSAPAFGFP